MTNKPLPKDARLCAAKLRQIFQNANIKTPALDAQILTAHAAKQTPETILSQKITLPHKTRQWLQKAAQKRLQGEPISRIIKRRNFWKTSFAINPHVLDPRPESETIIEAALAKISKNQTATILDLGIGSGCLLLSLLREMPKAKGIGIDLSHQALRTAQKNAAAQNLAPRARFINGNWGEALAPASFHIILANPPYIPTDHLPHLPAEAKRDPPLALDGGKDGIRAFAQILPQIAPLLTPDGFAILEIGAGQLNPLRRLAANASLRLDKITPDLSHIPRALTLTR